ncbi:MAG: PepSY-associated TM helix domain-containing protein [Oleiphilaceae bacterium]|nr:PepSY-associated TM helix domain-containing protein [Oleiphilaceae bacterium]
MRPRHWFRIHSFTGVITGLMLFLVCWSGTFAVLSQEIDWLVTPEARVSLSQPYQAEQAPWGDWAEAVERFAPDGEVLWLKQPLYSGFAANAVVNQPDQILRQLYIHPETAEIQGVYSYMDVQRFFRNFHMNLFGLGGFGIYLVTALGITLLVSLTAALFFYKRWWRRFFSFKGGTGRTLWSELHKLAGLWSLWLALIMGLTGTWYLIEIARLDVGDGKFSYVGTGQTAVHSIDPPEHGPEARPITLDAAVERARTLWPGFQVRQINPARNDNGIHRMEGQAGAVLVRDRGNQLYLDSHSGEVLYRKDAVELPLYWRWSHTADPLHFGDFGGLWSKAIWAVFGLILCGVILSGTWLHAHRLARSAGSHRRHHWPGTVAALLVTLLILAGTVISGFDQARNVYGPEVDGIQQLPELATGVRNVIIAWTALTLLIIAAWVALLWRPSLIHSLQKSPHSGAPSKKRS